MELDNRGVDYALSTRSNTRPYLTDTCRCNHLWSFHWSSFLSFSLFSSVFGRYTACTAREGAVFELADGPAVLLELN